MANSPARRRRYHQARPEIPPAIREAVERAARSVAPIRRDKALPLLQAIQAELGRLPAEALDHASRLTRIPLADLNALVSYYDLLRAEPDVIHVCDDVVCRRGQRARILAEQLQAAGVPVRLAPCLGRCDSPVAHLGQQDILNVSQTFAAPSVKGWLPGHKPLLLARCGQYDPADLQSYEAVGGLEALRKARALDPQEMIAQVRASGLTGRGGAGFPTGIKWDAVRQAPTPLGPGPDGAAKYVVVNADESEPGTFTNRVLMEEDPLSVVESALIAAHAVGATQIYIYIRAEYPGPIARIRQAIHLMHEAGHMAGVTAEVRVGGGRYVCGEETALFASIEGERGTPRVKPPFPTTNGLFDRPTLINNVETLANVLPLITLGLDAWMAAEPKLFSISGFVNGPGVYEVPMGTLLQDLVLLAGGTPGSEPPQAVLMGGASGMFIGPDQLTTPLEPRAMAAIGATLGSGAVMLFGPDDDLWDIARRAAEFFAHESCGKCVPCRVGTARQVDLVEHLAQGEREWIPLHQELTRAMADASICGLGQTAGNAVRSLLKLKGVR